MSTQKAVLSVLSVIESLCSPVVNSNSKATAKRSQDSQLGGCIFSLTCGSGGRGPSGLQLSTSTLLMVLLMVYDVLPGGDVQLIILHILLLIL